MLEYPKFDAYYYDLGITFRKNRFPSLTTHLRLEIAILLYHGFLGVHQDLVGILHPHIMFCHASEKEGLRYGFKFQKRLMIKKQIPYFLTSFYLLCL